MCPTCKSSSASRIAYAVLLLGGTIVACIMMAPDVGKLLEKVPLFITCIIVIINEIITAVASIIMSVTHDRGIQLLMCMM